MHSYSHDNKLPIKSRELYYPSLDKNLETLLGSFSINHLRISKHESRVGSVTSVQFSFLSVHSASSLPALIYLFRLINGDNNGWPRRKGKVTLLFSPGHPVEQSLDWPERWHARNCNRISICRMQSDANESFPIKDVYVGRRIDDPRGPFPASRPGKYPKEIFRPAARR